MLNIEYSNRDYFPSIRCDKQNKISSTLTCEQIKQRLQDRRLQRERQATVTINECQRLRAIHREDFNQRLQGNSNEKLPDLPSQPRRPTIDLLPKKINYADVIDRRVIPSIVEETIEVIQNDKDRCSRPSSTKPFNQRCPSVSTVSSTTKRTHRVYEKWPDYNEISQLVGYRIDPPASKLPVTRSTGSNNSRKRNSLARLIAATKQIKTVVSLNNASTRQESTKSKRTNKTELVAPEIIISAPTVVPPPPKIVEPPKLPNYICPSSLIYSQRIQTRQWLMKTNFAQHSLRTLPLI